LIIVGGGIAGSTAAFFAKEKQLDFLLLESNQRLGGVIQSEVSQNKKDHCYEKGPNTLKLGPTLFEICKKLDLNLVGSNPRAKDKYLYLDRKLIKLDFKSLLLEKEVLSNKDKLKFLEFLFKSPELNLKISKDITISEFFKLNFSEQILENLVWAILNGIYAGNPEKLSLCSIFPALYEISANSCLKKEIFLFSLIKFLCSRKKSQDINRKIKVKSKYFTFSNGLSQFFDVLKRHLRERVKTNSKVKKIEISKQESQVYQIKLVNSQISYFSKKIVLATPAKESAEIFPEFLNKLKQIKYAKVITVNLQISNLVKKELKRVENSFGFLSAKKKNISLLGVIYYASLFSSAKEKNLFTCFLGGELNPGVLEFSEEKIKKILIHDLEKIFPSSSPLEVELISINRWEEAIPQYNLGHLELIQEIEKSLPSNFRLAGNYLRGASIEQAALSGKFALNF